MPEPASARHSQPHALQGPPNIFRQLQRHPRFAKPSMSFGEPLLTNQDNGSSMLRPPAVSDRVGPAAPGTSSATMPRIMSPGVSSVDGKVCPGKGCGQAHGDFSADRSLDAHACVVVKERKRRTAVDYSRRRCFRTRPAARMQTSVL